MEDERLSWRRLMMICTALCTKQSYRGTGEGVNNADENFYLKMSCGSFKISFTAVLVV